MPIMEGVQERRGSVRVADGDRRGADFELGLREREEMDVKTEDNVPEVQMRDNKPNNASLLSFKDCALSLEMTHAIEALAALKSIRTSALHKHTHAPKQLTPP